METFAFFAITFEPIGILTHSAHQNDRLNLSFVIDKHTVDDKMARNARMMKYAIVIYIESEYSNHYENPITDPITKMGVARTCL